MPETLYLDLETYNTADIKVGTYQYGETAEVLLFAYAFDDGAPKVWDCTDDPVMPDDLWFALDSPAVILKAHNALFDRTMTNKALGVGTDVTRWQCTMAKALSHGFPGSLDAICKILGLPADKAKLADGKKLIHRFCKPAPSNHKAQRYTAESHPEEWQKFKDYAAMDIVAMREIDRRLPDWNWKQRDIALYHLDQRINDRGFLVDRALAMAGAASAKTDKQTLADEFIGLTNGDVAKPTQREKFRTYLNARFGLALADTKAETFRELIANIDDMDPVCRRLIEISLASNKSSTAKYAALAPAISPDNRFRGGLQFRGAARTRRWSGRNFQPQNLPSRGLPPQDLIETYIWSLKNGSHSYLFQDLMLYGSAALRGLVVAPERQHLAVADLSNIEGRVNAWLAGERWKIKAFFDFDAGTGPDLYNITAGSILGQDPYKITKKDRNVFGKVPELSLGYEAGYGGLQTFAKGYGVSFLDHWETIQANVAAETIAAAKANYTKWGAERNPEADSDEWIASETVKLAWRKRHPAIVNLWRACKDAAKNAILNPGSTHPAGPHLRFKMAHHAGHSYLLCRLPSGNFLCYFSPKYSAEDDVITYMGIDSTATGGMFGKWQRLYTYGGKIVENACQSLAMDIMAANMPRIEESGYPIILTVHDEILAEPTNGGTGAELAKLMAHAPDWLPDFPLAAAGFDCARYRKD